MISKITDNLYIGNANDARDTRTLDRLGITSVLNVAKDLNDPWDPRRRFHKIGLDDGNTTKYWELDLAKDVLRELIFEGEVVLLHCHEGRSRSSAVAILYFMDANGDTLEEAKNRVFQARPLCERMNPDLLTIIKG